MDMKEKNTTSLYVQRHFGCLTLRFGKNLIYNVINIHQFVSEFPYRQETEITHFSYLSSVPNKQLP